MVVNGSLAKSHTLCGMQPVSLDWIRKWVGEWMASEDMTRA